MSGPIRRVRWGEPLQGGESGAFQGAGASPLHAAEEVQAACLPGRECKVLHRKEISDRDIACGSASAGMGRHGHTLRTTMDSNGSGAPAQRGVEEAGAGWEPDGRTGGASCGPNDPVVMNRSLSSMTRCFLMMKVCPEEITMWSV